MKKLFSLIPIFFSLAALPSMAQNCGGNFTQYQVLSRTNGENFRQFSDINRDGKTDLITQDNSSVARFYLNNGSGFTDAGSLQLPLFGNVIAVKDFDNDGWADILSNSITGQTCLNNQIRIFWNTGQNNAFFNTGLSTNLPLPVRPYCMQSQDIDFNGDGLLDIISTSMPFSPSTNSPGRTYRNDGNRNFSVASDNLWPRDLYGTHTRDFNGDGKADFLVTFKDGWADGLRGMYYYRGNGNGTFQPVIVNFSTAPLAAGGFPIQADPLINSTEDVIMSLNGVSPATVKLGRWNGSSNFTFTDISIPAGFAAGQAFDLNKDGKQDLILFSTSGQTSVRAMLSNGNGGFTAEPASFLDAASYNLGTMFSDANNIQYVSGSNASSMVIYRKSSGQPSSISLNQSACLSYLFNGQTYTQSGTYTWTGTNSAGCDSVVTVNLTINQPSTKAVSASITEGQTYNFNGQTLTQAGTYTATLQNAAGCDSVVSLTLAVNPVPLTCGVTASKNTICAGEAVTLTASASGVSGGGNNSGLPLNLQQGLVAYYPFNGNANDESGNGNHGQAFGSPTFVQGVQGQGLKLNGINSVGGSGNPDRIRVPNSASLQFSDKMSVAYWVKIDGNQVQTPMNCSGNAISGISGTVLAKSGDRYGIYFSESETVSGFGVNPYFGGIGGSASGLTTVYQNYRHVVYSVDNNTISIYVNGVLKNVTNGNINYGNANGQDLNIGVQNNSAGACLTYWYPINGVLDEIGMWNRTLSASEVQQLYAPTTVSYLWSTGETTASINASPTANTTYSCTITNGTQTCTAEKAITVKQPSTSSETRNSCDAFTWNGQTYTQSGTYTWTGSNAAGCDSVATLNLTITPSTSNSTTASACDSYTWSVNGQSYTESGSYNFVNGCHTEILNLTITPSSSNTTAASACDSYTWSVNGQSYTESGSYNFVNGCHIEILNLTITPSSSNTTTASACDSYTWSVNGQSYTESGSYNFVNGCHTEILNLTISPSSSNTTTASACDSYTWSVNGQTYTNSGTYSIANGCYTEELKLTIKLSSQAPTGIQASATQTNGGTPVTLSIQGGNLGTSAVWKWYTSSCGGTLIGNGPSINVTPNLTTTYYVRAEGTCNTTNCQSVTITVNTAPNCGDGRYAEQVVSFRQQKAINGTAVLLGRSQSSKVLCAPQNNNTENFVSLGFGGDITLKFGKAIRNGSGNDIRVYETTFGNLSCTAYPEKARVFASQDGCRFVYLGEICQDGTVDLGSLTWAQYVRIVDVSSKTAVYQSSGIPDGYDVDAVEALNGFETNPFVDPIAGGASEVKSYLPGKCRGGANILVNRTDKNKALGVPQGTDVVNFVSLGFGGSITLRFKYAVENNPSGLDLQVVETSYGNPSCNSYPEKARFEGSIDGTTWTDLGQLCLDGKLEMGTLPYLHQLRITDESDKTKFGSSADGFDVDGVVAINQCTSSNTRDAVEIVDDINTYDELELAGILELYPNPASESATFSFSSQNASPYDLKIVNALGQIVYSTEGLATEGANTIELNLEYLSKGLYIVHLLQDGNKQQVSLVKK